MWPLEVEPIVAGMSKTSFNKAVTTRLINKGLSIRDSGKDRILMKDYLALMETTRAEVKKELDDANYFAKLMLKRERDAPKEEAKRHLDNYKDYLKQTAKADKTAILAERAAERQAARAEREAAAKADRAEREAAKIVEEAERVALQESLFPFDANSKGITMQIRKVLRSRSEFFLQVYQSDSLTVSKMHLEVLFGKASVKSRDALIAAGAIWQDKKRGGYRVTRAFAEWLTK